MREPPSAPVPIRNRLLNLLAASDLRLLRPHLQQVNLPKGEICNYPSKPIEYVYFLESGLGSSVIPDDTNGTSEVGMQGYEGLIGIPVVLSADQGPHEVFMQVGGTAQRIASAALKQAFTESGVLREALLRYAHVFMIQAAHTAHVNARFPLTDRLARWALMAADRLGSKLPLTHEYLSYMLGVRRSGVTDALHLLEGRHLIRSTRGLVTICDRRGLEAQAGNSYGMAEAEYRRLIGPLPDLAQLEPAD